MKNYLLILTTLTTPFILFTAKEVNAGKVYDTCNIGLTKPMIIKFKRNNSNRYVVKNTDYGTVLHDSADKESAEEYFECYCNHVNTSCPF